MEIPPEIAYLDVEKSAAIEQIIDEQIDRLEKVCDYITSCRIVLERPNRRPSRGSGYDVTLIVRLPPQHEIVVKRTSAEGDIRDALPTVLKDAFHAAQRQVREIARRQRGDVKAHPQQEPVAFVERLFAEEGYGFIRTIDGREIYFHRNSVLHDDFDRLSVGTGVRFEEEVGKDGPQATSLAVVDKPGVRVQE